MHHIRSYQSAKGTEEDEEDEDDVKEFINLLTTSVSEDLGDMPSFAAGVTLSWTLAQYKPAILDPLLPTIMKTFSKLCKDHITITHQGTQSTSKIVLMPNLKLK